LSKTLPYGSWPSPISARSLVAKAVALAEPSFDGRDILWLEGRPEEAGRTVVVRLTAGGVPQDVTPSPMNARTRVHEYGGGSYTAAKGTVFFSNFADGRLYRQEAGREPVAITAPGEMRYADFVADLPRHRLIAVREDHTTSEVVNTIVSVRMEGDRYGEVLVSGADFYAAPRLSPDGSLVAFLTWNHPRMPWDGTEIMLGRMGDDGQIHDMRQVAGADDESILEPAWSPDGRLTFLSDRSGFWNLYRLEDGGVRALLKRDAEFAGPAFRLAGQHYAYLTEGVIAAALCEDGVWKLGLIDAADGGLTLLSLPFTDFSAVAGGGGGILAIAASSTKPSQLVLIDPRKGAYDVLKVAQEVTLGEDFISPARPITFPTAGGEVAHAYHYTPKNPDFAPPVGETPPLLVFTHGGPTAAARPALDLGVQYWTTRGFAVVDVDYRGSTGYGRPYRDALRGRWGVVDVEDVVAAARHLADEGLADPRRLAIRGGSAGGYTTLAALTFTDVFAAGASYYGLSDLTTFVLETHKFESRYLDSLLGPWPEAREVYEERSPLFHVEDLTTPVIFFQGLEDRIVPPNQAEVMFEALRARNVPVAYIAYEGEGHGFRRSENIIRSEEAELVFYGRVMGFTPAGNLPDVPIENMP